MRPPVECRNCAYAGESAFGEGYVFCFRRHRNMPERERCDKGLPLKASSRRFRRRSGRKERNGPV